MKHLCLIAVISCISLVLLACGDDEESSPTQVIPADGTSPSVPASQTPTTAPASPSPTPVPTNPPAAGPTSSSLVAGNLTAELPAGDSGQVSVLAVGPIDRGGSVPIIARNNTPNWITRVHLSGTARGPDGALLASGEDQGMNPTIVGPGEIVFGYIYFGFDTDFPDGTSYEVSATWEEGDTDDYFLGLEITEVNQLEDRMVGILSNQLSEEVSGPISIDVICFDSDGQVLSTDRTFADQDTVAAGGTGSF